MTASMTLLTKKMLTNEQNLARLAGALLWVVPEIWDELELGIP